MTRKIQINAVRLFVDNEPLWAKGLRPIVEIEIDVEPMLELGNLLNECRERYGIPFARQLEDTIDTAIVSHVLADQLLVK